MVLLRGNVKPLKTITSFQELIPWKANFQIKPLLWLRCIKKNSSLIGKLLHLLYHVVESYGEVSDDPT